MKVLITGASRGLGFALSKVFAENGHTVIAGARLDKCNKNLDNLHRKYPDTVEIADFDVLYETSVANAAKVVEEKFGSLDVIINNAAILVGGDKKLEELDINEVSMTLDVNAVGPVRVLKHFIPLICKGKDQVIINVSSEAGSISTCGTSFIAYCMSKAALNMLNQITNNYLKGRNIRVYAVHPGRMNTDMGAKTAQIEAEESAQGIFDIVTGKREVSCDINFIDYFGRPMPL